MPARAIHEAPLEVPLSYPVYCHAGSLNSLGAIVEATARAHRYAVISDETVAGLFADRVRSALPGESRLFTIPPGEHEKTRSRWAELTDALFSWEAGRDTTVIALGGGVIGDLAGFVAATFMRGIPVVQVPTTLLSMVDAAVGGKTAVDTPFGKNLVGAFHDPSAVVTLPERELRAGLAEVIKYGIIHDAAFFRRLERDLDRLLARDPKTLASVIARCCEIKAEVVGQDETETGLRAILNFGHTIGHGLEASSRYGTYLHGEAISIGQVAAAWLSAHQLGLPAADLERIRRLFERAGLPVTVRLKTAQERRLFEAMRLDKKSGGGELRFVLAEAIGRVRWGQPVPESLLAQALHPSTLTPQ